MKIDSQPSLRHSVTTKEIDSSPRYVILGGTSKAATTAVFNVLCNHPEICPSNVKETRFFLDEGYPLEPRWNWETDPDLKYSRFFDPDDKRNVRLEATPDYMYSEHTPARIREELQNVELVFILREPVSRLISWYRFAKSRAVLSSDIDFETYVQGQTKYTDLYPQNIKHPAFLALPHGKYSRYLERFVDNFGLDRIHVLVHEDLNADPLRFMNTLCQVIRVDPEALNYSSVRTVNKSFNVRSPFFHRSFGRLKQDLRDRMRSSPKGRAVLRRLGSHVDTLYKRLNVDKNAKLIVSESTKSFLSDYYRDEADRLRQLFGITIPW